MDFSFRGTIVMFQHNYYACTYKALLVYILTFTSFTFQDTVVGLQALSLYNIRTFASQVDMESTLTTSSNQSFVGTIDLTPEDCLVEKSVHNVREMLFIIAKRDACKTMYMECMTSILTGQYDMCHCKYNLKI